MEHLISIHPDGDIEFIYDDRLRPLLDSGEPDIRRASHVEPTCGGGWQADLAPIGGPVLLPTPTRRESLEREVKWIESHYLIEGHRG